MTSNASVALVSNADAFGETPDSRARFKMLEDLRFWCSRSEKPYKPVEDLF
jgi:hypothetical protein